ncbi:MAG: radical SAM protein [candidate division WOR-3 bacterium]
MGCNFRCKFCHNWHLSQRSLEDIEHYYFPPESVVALALKNKLKTISFTYNDPIAFYEYVYDIAQYRKINDFSEQWLRDGESDNNVKSSGTLHHPIN